ncbi:MAG: squalene--hopene cyclase [Candidatus Methylacidiphilales bacterium]
MSASQAASRLESLTMAAHELRVAVEPDLKTQIDTTISRVQQYMIGLQHPDGHWRGELTVDNTVAADYLTYLHWRGQVDFDLQQKIVKHTLDRQQPDGGWNTYTGGLSEINASVKGYLVLKLAGYSEDEPVMKKARSVILRLGGIPKMNTYGKLHLALLGLFPWKYLPSIPVEMILLPNWFYFNIYEMSSWTRAMYVPLAIINHFRPIRLMPPEKQLHELYPYGTENQDFSLPFDQKMLTWRNFFLCWDRFFKILEKLPYKPFRRMALRKAEHWILERCTEGSDGLGAIFPSIVETIIAFKCLGYSDDNPVLRKQEKDLEDFFVYDKEKDDFRIQPCLSPVWDTAITSVALAQSGIPSDDPRLVKAADWLLDREVKRKGDWVVKNPYPHASGWAFEYNNDYYPDVDDTFKILIGLTGFKASDTERQKKIMRRAMEWARSFQCTDGGFAAFDKNINKKWLEHVPFADHNAILDPSCSDITARGLEAMGKMGYPKDDPIIKRAIIYLKNTQEEDGSWWGRWGVNYIYGTWQALRGLHYIGEDMNQDWIVRARDWLESSQNPDGGWGETPESYNNPALKGKGPSTPSQTAWAMMGLLTSGDPHRSSLQRGARYLAATQNDDGSWDEEQITGTGFPCVFYLKYEYYCTNWPMIALSELRALMKLHGPHALAVA